MADFKFAPHIPPSERPPLTARSTVTHATASGVKNEPIIPVPAAAFKSPGQERNKDDPLLTRLIYQGLRRVPKVPLEKGYSQMDWLRLTRSKPTPVRRREITLAEVKQHSKPEDAWMVFQDKVYDITPYLNFHPGGRDILLKAAGKDGTSLFMKYHPWVNIGALMEKCLLGTLANPSQAARPTQAPAPKAANHQPASSMQPPSARAPSSPIPSMSTSHAPYALSQQPEVASTGAQEAQNIVLSPPPASRSMPAPSSQPSPLSSASFADSPTQAAQPQPDHSSKPGVPGPQGRPEQESTVIGMNVQQGEHTRTSAPWPNASSLDVPASGMELQSCEQSRQTVGGGQAGLAESCGAS